MSWVEFCHFQFILATSGRVKPEKQPEKAIIGVWLANFGLDWLTEMFHSSMESSQKAELNFGTSNHL